MQIADLNKLSSQELGKLVTQASKILDHKRKEDQEKNPITVFLKSSAGQKLLTKFKKLQEKIKVVEEEKVQFTLKLEKTLRWDESDDLITVGAVDVSLNKSQGLNKHLLARISEAIEDYYQDEYYDYNIPDNSSKIATIKNKWKKEYQMLFQEVEKIQEQEGLEDWQLPTLRDLLLDKTFED